MLTATKEEAKEIGQKLNKILIDESTNRIKLLLTEEIKEINLNELRVWCAINAVYTIPTYELIEFLNKEKIGLTIEIGSGNNDIGYHLGILQTDSYCQTEGIGLLNSILHKSSPTIPKEDVIRINANDAVDKYKPDTVIGSFITQLYQKGDEEKNIGSSVLGVDEINICSKVKKYIHLGNSNVHQKKRILQKGGIEILTPSFLITRCEFQNLNFIALFNHE